MKSAVLSMCCGELWWEFANFAPYIIWKRLEQYRDRSDVDFIVMTRPERFDIYGLYANIYVPLKIEGEGVQYNSDGFRLSGLPNEKYHMIAEFLKGQFSSRYNNIELIYPTVHGRTYVNRHQFPSRKMLFSYLPRRENGKLVNSYLPSGKELVALASRFRKGYRRNWPNWKEFYDLLYSDTELMSNYNFVICGKAPDYVPDPGDRFFDLNKIQLGEYSSLIGLTIETLRKSILTVGSQSGIPNISLMLGTPVLEWGHERQYHTIDYNLKQTPVVFIEDRLYVMPASMVLEELKNVLKSLKEGKL